MKKAKTRYREQTERGGYLYPLETYRFHFDQREKNTPQMCVSYHWHPELEILLIQEGELAITIEGSEYPGTSGDIFFVNPEFLHTMYAQAGQSTLYNALVFDLSFLSFQMYDYVQSRYMAPLLSGKLKFPEKIPAAHPDTPLLRTYLEKILAYNDQRGAHYQFETKLTLLSFIMELYQKDLLIRESERSPGISSEQVNQIKEILLYIQGHYQERIPLDEIAGYFHLSPKYFSRYFKKQFGRSFTEYVNAYRIEQSLPLLEDKNLSILDAALRCGFESLSYYVKVFRSIMGITPGEYRRQN